MTQTHTYQGSCFCGAVRFTVSGEPEGMGYCHCGSCRSWSASPVNAFTLWKPAALTITHGSGKIAAFEKNPGTLNETVTSIRKWCTNCGGHLYTEHPTIGLVDVYAACLPDFPFKPGIHVHYQETVLPMKDGLTKMQDLPSGAGGSGVELAEEAGFGECAHTASVDSLVERAKPAGERMI